MKLDELVLWLEEGESSYEIAGLRDKPRSGKPPKLSKEKAERIRQRIGDGTGWRTKTIRWLIRENNGMLASDEEQSTRIHILFYF